MSHTRVLIAVALAAVLALAAILLLRDSGSSGEPPAAVQFAFDPARVVELRVEYPGETTRLERISRDAGSGDWTVYWNIPGGEESRWPAAPAQVRSALRILSTIEPMAAEDASRIDDPAARLHIALDDGNERRLNIAGRALAGRALAEIGDADQLATVWLDSSVQEMLIGSSRTAGGGNAGPRAWRDPSALPGAGADVSRATLEADAGTLALARVQGRWALRHPVAEVAEPDAVSKLFTSLANVRVIDFLDDVTVSPDTESSALNEYGLDEPVATLTLESDRRDAAAPEAPPAILRRTLTVGHTADLAGKNVFARVRQELQAADRHSLAFDRILIVSGESLAAIAMDPAAYIARRTFPTPASEVGGLTLRLGERVKHFKRTLDGWRMDSLEGPVPLLKEDADGLAALLHLVMQAPASTVALTDEPVTPISLELTTLGGSPIGDAMLAMSEEGHIGIYSRGVMRLHDAESSQKVLQWLAR